MCIHTVENTTQLYENIKSCLLVNTQRAVESRGN